MKKFTGLLLAVFTFLASTAILSARPQSPVNMNQSSWQNMMNFTYLDDIETNLEDVDDSLCYTPKDCNGYNKSHGTWKYNIDEFFSPSGSFTFRIYVTSPKGKLYKSELLSSDNLPALPYSIEIKNPIKGNYLVFIKLESINTPGSIGFIASTSNSQNNSSYISVYGLGTDPKLIGKKLIMSGFAVPH